MTTIIPFPERRRSAGAVVSRRPETRSSLRPLCAVPGFVLAVSTALRAFRLSPQQRRRLLRAIAAIPTSIDRIDAGHAEAIARRVFYELHQRRRAGGAA